MPREGGVLVPWVVTLTILVASAFLMDMSFTMITPFLPVYLSSELGTKASEVDMWSGAVFAVTFFVPVFSNDLVVNLI